MASVRCFHRPIDHFRLFNDAATPAVNFCPWRVDPAIGTMEHVGKARLVTEQVHEEVAPDAVERVVLHPVAKASLADAVPVEREYVVLRTSGPLPSACLEGKSRPLALSPESARDGVVASPGLLLRLH